MNSSKDWSPFKFLKFRGATKTLLYYYSFSRTYLNRKNKKNRFRYGIEDEMMFYSILYGSILLIQLLSHNCDKDVHSVSTI